MFHPWSRVSDVRYSPFMRRRIPRKRAILVLVKLPLIAAVALVLFTLGTRTYEVRSHIHASTRLVVRTGGNCHRDPERERQLYETEGADSIRRLADGIALKFGLLAGQCECCGEITFDMYKGDDLHYSFSLHHGRNIRIKDSSFGDRKLTSLSRQNLARWLNERGIPGEMTGL